MKKYRKRIADEILKRKLLGKGAILIEGPKWCGKTTTSEQIAKSVLYVDDPEKRDLNIKMSEINPKRLLEGVKPRLIDEWQLIPKIWDAIRFDVDHNDELGQYILTGSATPISNKDITHSGTGRFSRIIMRTMSLYESNDSTGDVSLLDLFSKKTNIDGFSNINLEKLAFLICRGGWPKSIDLDDEIALEQPFDYLDAVVKSDINRVGEGIKDENKVRKFMRSYARHQGSQISNAKLALDLTNNSNPSLSETTISSYINALTNIFVIEELSARNPNLRSKTAIRTSSTRYFIDPSIAVASLGIGPNDLLNDLNTFGLFFETLCIRDLRIYAESLNGQVYHYRDKDDLECDAVIHLRNGKYGLIEIKLGGEKLIEEACLTLKKLNNKIDKTKMNEPSFLMVLVGIGDYPYLRNDGIYVVPIGCLKN